MAIAIAFTSSGDFALVPYARRRLAKPFRVKRAVLYCVTVFPAELRVVVEPINGERCIISH